jgi:serine/threonine protein kinase
MSEEQATRTPGPWQQGRGDPDAPPIEHIGPYTLLRPLGEGGMGIVYLAEQKVPVERLVALKVIKLGMDTREVVTRFEAGTFTPAPGTPRPELNGSGLSIWVCFVTMAIVVILTMMIFWLLHARERQKYSQNEQKSLVV